ncbi:MAG: flippase [Sedimentisphaerales bacterium]|nr:flippase [Sedimentisphaerales bacterium]
MRTTQRIAKNSGVYFFAQIISYILSFFFFMYAARYLGAESFGILSFALALVAIIGAFGDLGLRQIATREVARNKSLAKKYLGNIVGIKIILVTIVLGILVLAINLLGCPGRTKAVVYLISLSIVFNAFLQAFYSIFQAHERMEFESAGNILRSILLLVCVLFVIRNNSSVLVLALSYSLVGAVTLGYAFIISLWKFEKPKIEIDWSFCKTTLKEALPFGLTAVFGMTYHWIGTVMLSTMKGDVVVGWYSAAYRMIMVLLFIPSAFDAAVFPVMSHFYICSQDSLKLICEKGFKYLTFVSVPIGIAGTVLADRIILLFFGGEYANSIMAFKILVWSAVFIFMGTPFATVLNSTNKQVVLAKIVGVSVIANILLNLALIPRYGLVGTGISSVISILLLNGLSAIVVGYRLGKRVYFKGILNSIIKAAISGAAMGLVIFWFKEVNLCLVLVFSASLYFLLLYIIGGFDGLDLAVMRGLTARR